MYQQQEILSKAIELAKNPKVQLSAGLLLALKALGYLNAWYTKRKVKNHVSDPSWDWSREIVVVTGGSSGIGAAIVSRFAEKGIKVLIMDRNPPATKLAANTCFYKVDLTESEAISSVVDQIREDHGNPTVLINNAGFAELTSILDSPESYLRKLFDVNLLAPYLLTEQCLPSMIKRDHGHIVNIASQASFATQATNVAYGSTKLGLLAFHEGLGQELRYIYKAPRVRTRTAMTAEMVAKGKLKDTVTPPEVVANRIFNQVISGFGAQIIVPSNLWWTSLIRGLPGWLQESLRNQVTFILINAMGTGPK
ncbi:retinal short-chain dehydrogenase reductase [Fusarium subglutinans]|uniref:Retinal short-chain dehydrogenase reductase n=1 Tax=Gibberella subglutinans TaxID=42677 RepID=A0A8H5Q046_GIBSU|nr:retinal short-chain dehydrogenase reductase [Fusarium subglutinans]KAF5606207.1 retinal short-chain dehydrogenase reductase [Fusarium subglutinans]